MVGESRIGIDDRERRLLRGSYQTVVAADRCELSVSDSTTDDGIRPIDVHDRARMTVMKLRTVITAMTLLTAGTVIGASTQHFALADVSSGDRPVLVPIEPCRLVDTRTAPAPIGPRTTPLAAAESLTVNAHQPSTPCAGVIPVDASAVSLNVTAVNPTQQTFLTIWADGPRPLASSLNPSAGSPPVPNAVTTELSATDTFQIYNDAGTVNVLVDVNGYYENHDHDDRYYTRDEVDGALASKANAADVYTKAEVDSALAVLAPSSIAVTVGNGEGVGGTTCSATGIEIIVKNALGHRVDARFSFIVPDYAYGQIRADGSVRNGSPNVASAEHPSDGAYCIVFSGPGPSQVQAESTVASVHGEG